MTYTMGSLFAGIGGFDLGFERAGFKTLWQVEIDPYAQKVLAKNFPEAERFGDIRECGSHNLKPVDVICGGFPCQDISNAGKRAGIEGERSGLWSEMHRIISELRPRYVLVENVAALLGRGMGRVLGDLAEIGYDAEWEVVSAADVGAPHLRERVWLLAYPKCVRELQPQGSKQDEWGWTSNGGSKMAHTDDAGLEGWDGEKLRQRAREWLARPGCACAVDDTMRGRYGAQERAVRAGRNSSINTGQWLVEPNVGRVAHGVPARVDRLRGLGNAVVPQIPEMFAHRIREALEAA
jgi:DNA (cytosine-5)-methyltransferase 1